MLSTLRDPWLWVLVAVNAAVKVPLLGLNEAEYTDGLILLGLFENHCPFYMPLFPALSSALAALGVEPIFAGRVVSLIANTAVLIPLHLITVWLTGSRAAGRWAVALCLVSPIPTRWGLRVMTDSLFALGWWVALAAFFAAFPRTDDKEKRAGAVSLCLLAGMLAALTRQTGWLLLPLGCVGLFAVLREGGWRRALMPMLCLLTWAAPLGWMLSVGAIGGHGGQVEARFTWQASLILLESYAVDWPLFLGWPLAILTVWGLVRPIATERRWWMFIGVMVWSTVGILALQCLIQSYLARYLLPLVGFVCILGGGALARLGAERPRWLVPVATVTLAVLVIFNVSSLWLQRTAWGDFRAGAERMGEVAEPATRCFANETYATWPPVGTTKAAWWSGREVEPLLTVTPLGARLAALPAGSLVLISTAYGGPAAAEELVRRIRQEHGVEVMGEWHRRLTPLLPDLMDGRPIPTHQHPLAVRFRRVEQEFATILLRITDALP